MKKKLAIIFLLFILIIGSVTYFFARTKAELRLFMSMIYLSTHTLADEEYFLYGLDLMELCRDYINGEVSVTGKMGVDHMEKVKSSVYMTVDAKRSFEQRKLSCDGGLKFIVFPVGDLYFYAEDETVYLDAPVLGEDIGYAFPTGTDLFRQAPNMTHDIDQQWFKDNMKNIAKLLGQMDIEKTGKTVLDKKGRPCDEFKVTMHRGTGAFIWELLGMKAPDHDIVSSIYLTKSNHIQRIEMDLSEIMKGASVVIDGESIGTIYTYLDLPDNERVEVKAFRNPEYDARVDVNVAYYTNIDQNLYADGYVTWVQDDKGFDIKAKDIVVKQDKKTLGEMFFIGRIEPGKKYTDLFAGQQERLKTFEVLQWKEVRNDTESFINDVLEKTGMTALVD